MIIVTVGGENEPRIVRIRRSRRGSPTGEPEPIFLSPAFGVLAVLKTLDSAKVEETDQAELLGVSLETLHRYKHRKAVPTERAVLDRIEDLLRCHALLKVIYVRDYRCIDCWYTGPNLDLTPNPIEHMKRFGTRAVRDYLEAYFSR